MLLDARAVGGVGGSGGAPTDATYITQTPNATLTNEQALSALATGLLLSTTGTGVLSIAAQGVDYYAPGGTDVAVNDGGTGASTAGGARTNLGTAPLDATFIVQTANAELSNEQVLASLATGLVKNTTGTGVLSIGVAGTDYLSPAAIGVTVQAWDADLDAIAALSNADNNFIVGNGAAWVAESGATARASMGAAPNDAAYIVQTANGELSGEQALGALATGLLKNTTVTGVLSIAAEGTDYFNPPFLDTNALVKGSADATKLLRFEVDGFSAGVTRVLTPPNQDATIAGLEVTTQTFTGINIFTGASGLQAYRNGITSNFVAGSSAANGTMSGGNNVVIGDGAGPALSSGSDNVFLGAGAGQAVTTGIRNFALGTGALVGVSTNSNTVAIGWHAGFQASGQDGVYIGSSAGPTNSGRENVCIGGGSGSTITTGRSNTLIGHSTNVSSGTIQGAIALGRGATATASNQLVIGADNSIFAIVDAYFGRGVTSATVNTMTINPTGGLGTDIAGWGLTLAGGKGTGTGAGGTLTLQVAPAAGSSGSSLNALVNAIAIASTKLITIGDAFNFVFNTTTGSKLGTATTQKLGFWNATPVVQPTGIADADGTLADITTKFNSLLGKLETIGLLAVA